MNTTQFCTITLLLLAIWVNISTKETPKIPMVVQLVLVGLAMANLLIEIFTKL